MALAYNPAPLRPIRYRIAPRDPQRTCSRSTARRRSRRPTGQRFRLPTWIPGSYLIREFARHFVAVRARERARAPCDREDRQGHVARGAVRRAR